MITEYGRSLYRSNFPIIVLPASVVFHIHSEHSLRHTRQYKHTAAHCHTSATRNSQDIMFTSICQSSLFHWREKASTVTSYHSYRERLTNTDGEPLYRATILALQHPIVSNARMSHNILSEFHLPQRSQYRHIWTLQHKWKYIIGCNISIFPYKLLSWTLTILTSLPTIACHQQYYSTSPIQLSASYAIVLFACTSCICKVLLYRISYASTSNNNSCCIVK